MADKRKRTSVEILLWLKDKVSGPLGRVQSRLGSTARSVDTLRKNFDAAERAGGRLIRRGLALGGVLVALFASGVVSASNFETSMAEIETLVDTTQVSMADLEGTVNRLSTEFGSMPTDTAKAFYQTISAGFSDAADAEEVMRTGLRLARGGITDTFTAVDGLTSLLKVYGLEAGAAGGVSDSLFVAMKMGKTNIGQLSSSLGQVSSLAATTGTNIDEMTAAVAALTLGGKSTSEAVTGLRGMLSAVLKPTAEASRMAKRLGIDFSAAGIRAAGGFENWLNLLIEKTGGSEKALAQLFGDVEGLAAALSLTGKQSGDFAEIMDAMRNKTGATGEAFAKMDSKSRAAFDKAKANAIVAWNKAFNQFLPVATDALNAFAGIAKRAGDFAEKHPGVVKFALGAGFAFASILVLGGGMLKVVGSTARLFRAMKGLGVAYRAVSNWAQLAGWMIKANGGAFAVLGRTVRFVARGVLWPFVKIGKLAVVVFKFMGGALGLLGKGIFFVGRALLALMLNPVGLIIIAIIALVAGIYLLITRFDEVVQWFKDLPANVKKWWGKLVEWWKGTGKEFVDKFVEGVKKAWADAMEKIRGLFRKLRNKIFDDDQAAPISLADPEETYEKAAEKSTGKKRKKKKTTGGLLGGDSFDFGTGSGGGGGGSRGMGRGGSGVNIGSLVINVNSSRSQDVRREVVRAMRMASYQMGGA